MQLGWDEHFKEIVVPSWQAYLRAEDALSQAVKSDINVGRACFDALREGGAAVIYLHHFADIVAVERPQFLPAEITNVAGVRKWLSQHCTMLRTSHPVEDVALLGDIADALKHSRLTHRLEGRDVDAFGAVVVTGSGYGVVGWGEGKYGGMEQVLILANSGTRALSSILQNVIDAWRRGVGWDIPNIGSS